MAITTELVGKLGGGLSWTKVTGTQRTLAWNDQNQVVTSVNLGVGKQYLFAMEYTYVSGTPAGGYFTIGERKAGQTYSYWVTNGSIGITAGTRQYPFMVANPLGSSGIVEIKFSPTYQSGTHVLSADLYYAEMPTL